jgi:hypothetical protein
VLLCRTSLTSQMSEFHFFFETYTAREAPAVVGSIISIKRSYCTNCSPGGQERREKLSVQINERTKGGLFHN